jgi:hypothetical protein
MTTESSAIDLKLEDDFQHFILGKWEIISANVQ